MHKPRIFFWPAWPRLLFAAALAGGLLAPLRPAQAADPCAQIAWGYSERIESQGFLGLLTPEASWKAVAQSVNDAYHTEDPNRPPGTPLPAPFELRPFCQILLDRGIRQISVACKSDTSVLETCHATHDGYCGGGESHLTATCVFSRHPGTGDPSWDDYWKRGIGAWETVESSVPDRHAAIADVAARRRLYARAIYAAVNDLVNGIQNLDDLKRIGDPPRPNPYRRPDEIVQCERPAGADWVAIRDLSGVRPASDGKVAD